MNKEKRMKTFNIKLAKRVVGIEPIHDYLRKHCKDYITNAEAEFVIRIEYSDIIYEREKSEREDIREGIPIRTFSEEYLETLAVYRKIAERFIDFDILLFHGSVVAIDGQGYLFAAKSGTGKSTHTRLWRELWGERAVMINDDKPLLTVSKNGVMVHGTPWMGKHGLGTNVSVPLKAICILTRSNENHIEKLLPKDVYGMLLQHVYRPTEAKAMAKTMELLDRLMEHVQFYRLECNISLEAARVAYEGMNGGLK